MVYYKVKEKKKKCEGRKREGGAHGVFIWEQWQPSFSVFAAGALDGSRVGAFRDTPPAPRTHILREITRGHERTGPWVGRDPEGWPGLRNAFQGLSWDERQMGVCWNLGTREPQWRDRDLHPQPLLPGPPPPALRFHHPSRAGMNCPVLIWGRPSTSPHPAPEFLEQGRACHCCGTLCRCWAPLFSVQGHS